MRRTAVQQLVESVGGKLETIYFGFGSEDVHIIIDAPDNIAVAAATLTAGAAGAAGHEDHAAKLLRTIEI